MQPAFQLGDARREGIVLLFGHDVRAVQHLIEELAGLDSRLLGLGLALADNLVGPLARLLPGQLTSLHQFIE